MKRFVMFAASLVLTMSMAACAVAGASGEYPSTKIRYKMTVEVDTPEGVKTGSAVREISMVSRPMLMGESNDTHVKLEKGEAVVVDLGTRGVLFALLSGNGIDAISTFFRAFPTICAEGAVSRCSIKYYSSLKVGQTSQLTPRSYPMFVMFDNLNDPKSVRSILDMKLCPDPETGISDNSRCIERDRFEEIFGQGVRLRSVTVEVSNLPVSWGIEHWLKWLPEKKGVPGVIGSTKENVMYQGSLGLTGFEFSVGKFW